VQELSGSTVTANMLAGGVDEVFQRTDAGGATDLLADVLGSNNHAGIGTADSLPNFWNITTPSGTQRAGWYHTHAAFDPGVNGRGNPAPGQPDYNWHNDGNEIMSDDDMEISDQLLHGLP